MANTSQPQGDGHSIVLRQRTGDKAEITLLGADMPDAGINVGVTQRVSRTWLPGAVAPISQVLGPTQDDIKLKGRIRDDMSGTGAAIAFDIQMRKMASQGYSIDIEYGTAWSKSGLISSYNPSAHADGYLEYEITLMVDTTSDSQTSLAVAPWQKQTAGELIALVAIAKANANPLLNLARASFASSLVTF